MDVDAIVIGAGHNGLVAANGLADAGWSVLVCEAQDEPGGAVRSGEITAPGFVSDRFSAFYPFGYASPAIRGLELEDHGLEWVRSRGAVAHPEADGRCALISVDLEETMGSLDAFAPGDGEAWRRLYERFRRVGPALVEALVTPFPPVRAGARILRGLGFSPAETLDFARFALLPARRLSEETFRGEGGGWLLAGNALHADLTPETNGGGVFGWLLCGLGQMVGFPVPRGGSGSSRAHSCGGWRRAAAPCAVAPRPRPCWSTTGAPPACGWPAGRSCGPGARCSLTRRRRRCSSGCCRPTPFPSACTTGSRASSGTARR